MFFETAIVNYHFSFATKENKLLLLFLHICSISSSLPINLRFAANKQKLPFPVSSVFQIYIYGQRTINMVPFQTENENRKLSDFA